MSTWSLTVNSFPIFFLGLCIKASHVWWGYLHDDELFIIDVFMFVFFALPWSIKSVTDMFTQCHSLHCLELTFTINIYNLSYWKDKFFPPSFMNYFCIFKGLLHILLAYQTWKQVISSFSLVYYSTKKLDLKDAY